MPDNTHFGFYHNTETGDITPRLGYSYAPRHLWTNYEQTAFDSGIAYAIEVFTKMVTDNICFDALADEDGRCPHHGGKCYELGQLIINLKKGLTNG